MVPGRLPSTVAPLIVGGTTVLFGYLTTGAIENDHFVMLARAFQVLYGDWPVRDFEDPGQPLAYFVSTAAAWLFGPTLLVNVVLSLLFLGVTSAVTYLLARRATGSEAAGLLAALVTVAVRPRLYNTTKVIVPVVAMSLAWMYADRASVRRLLGPAAWTAVAFLLRHDYIVYVAAANVVLLIVHHRAAPSDALRRVVVYSALVLLFVAPWLLYVQHEEGLRDYFTSALRFTVAEGRRTAGVPTAASLGLLAIPVVGLLVATQEGTPLTSAQLASTGVLVLLMDLVFVRDVVGARLPDVVAATSVLVAGICGRLVPRRIIARLSALTVAAVVLVAAVYAAPNVTALDVTRQFGRVTHRLASESPEIQPDPVLAPLVAFLGRCTQPSSRVLVGGFGPEIPVLAHRAFASGLPAWIPGYYDDARDVSRALTRLNRERVGAIVMLDRPDMFARSWPGIDEWIRQHGFEEYAVPSIDTGLRILLPRQPATSTIDRETNLPCEAR